MTIKELGRLAQTCQVNQSTIHNDDEVWHCVLNHMNYKIPKGVVATLGHKWLVKQIVSNKNPIEEDLTSTLPPPRLTSDDMMIIYEMGLSKNGEEKVGRGCITGTDLEPLLSEGKIDLPLVNPIVVGNAKPYGSNFVGPVRNDEDDIIQFWVNAQLLRIPDKQSCCIFSDKDSCCIFSDKDFLRVRVGRSKSGYIEMKNDSPLALRDSPVADKIKNLFDYDFFFEATVYFDVTAEKQVEMTKVVLQAKKRKFHLIRYQVFHFIDNEPLNNDVTIAHILSELQCNE